MEHLNAMLIACGTILMATAFMLLAKRSMDKDKAEQEAKHPLHHDNRKGSYYYESHNAKKEDY